MLVAIRVDASRRIGTGHLVRCLTLADALRARGASCLFLHRAHAGHMGAAIRERGHQLRLLPPPPELHEPAADDDYAAWLGVPPATDATQSQAALGDLRPDWLLVDHYALDADWESRLRPRVGWIAILDDLANRPHDADLLVDPNYSDEGTRRYADLLPPQAERLCGPRYALLDPVYGDYRKSLPDHHPGRVDRALVFFGGTDPENLTGRALGAFTDAALDSIELDVVVGANNPHRKKIEVCANQRPKTTLHGPRPHLADLMSAVDLAVGAGGSTVWERCFLGLPSLVVSIAENQRPACGALAAAGIIAYIGHADCVDESTLTTELRSLAHDPLRLTSLSEAGRSLVDGEGTVRVVEALLAEEWSVSATLGEGRPCL